MYLIFIVICIIGVIRSEEDGPESKYVDMLPEVEKRHFLDKIARRILEEVKSEKVANASDIEITEDQLNKHSEYVQKIFKEESDNLKNISETFNETFRAKEFDDDPMKVGALNKDEEKEQIDLTLRSNKRIKRKENPQELMLTTIPVQVVYDDETITIKSNDELPSNVESNLTVSRYGLNSTLENITKKKDKQDIQVRNFRKFVRESKFNTENTTVVIQTTGTENINAERQETINDAITSTDTTNIESSFTESTTFYDETETTTGRDLEKESSATQNIYETHDSYIDNGENHTTANKTIFFENNMSIATEETNTGKTKKNNDSLQNRTENKGNIMETEVKQNETKQHLKTDSLTNLESKKLTETTTNFVQEMSVQATDVSNAVDTTTIMSLEMLSTRETATSTTKPIKSLENLLTDARVTKENNVIDTNHLIDKLKNILRQTLRLQENDVNDSNEMKANAKELRTEKANNKEYNVYEINGDRPPFAQEQQEREQLYHVPIYNFAPNNAYYNPYNRLGPNYQDKNVDTKEIIENIENNPKVENIDGSTTFDSNYYFDSSELKDTDEGNRKFTFADRKSQNGMQKRKNKSAKLELPIVNRKPKYTEIYFNPDDYLDFDYYYGRMDGSLPGPTKLRKGYTTESDMLDEDYERSNQTESSLKNHLAFVRHMLNKNEMFGYVPSVAEKIKTENDTDFSDIVTNDWPRPVIRMRNNDTYVIIIPQNSKNVIRALKKTRDIDLDYYFDLINDNDYYRNIRKAMTDLQWEKEKKKIQSKSVPGQVYRPIYDFYNNYAYFEDQVKTSNSVLFRLKQFGKFKEGLDNRYDLWRAMYRVPFKTFNTNLKLIRNLTDGGWLTQAEGKQLRKILINLKFKNNRMFGISRNPKVNKNWNENSTIGRTSNDNLRKGNNVPFIIIVNSKYFKNKKKVRNVAKNALKNKYGNAFKKNMLLKYITRRFPMPDDKLLNYFKTIKHIQEVSNPISSITVDQIKTSNDVLFRLHKFGKFKEGLDTKKDLIKAINEVPDDVFFTIRLMIIDMTKGRQFLTKAEARKLIVILLNMKNKRYSYFGLSENLRKLYDRISKMDAKETVSVDELLKEIGLNFGKQVSTNKNKQKKLDTNINEESDNAGEEVDTDIKDNVKHRRFTSIELKKIKELNDLMNIPEVPTPDLHLDQIETAKLALFRLFQFGKFDEGLDNPKQLDKAIKQVPGEVIESIIDILYDMEEHNKLKEKERIRLEGILYRIKDKNYKYFNLLNWSPANKTKKIHKISLRSSETMDLIENDDNNKDMRYTIFTITEALKSLLKKKEHNKNKREKIEALDDKKENNNEPKDIEISELISEEIFNANFDILRDMIVNSNRALIQYDWLGTAVDIRSAIKKVDYLSNELQNEVYIHPSDLELLKYVVYLHTKAKKYYDSTIKEETKKGFLKEFSKPTDRQRILPKSNHNTGGKITNPISLIKKLFSYTRLRPKRELRRYNSDYDLINIKDFLSELQFGLNNLHTAIKHVAMITKLKEQRWFQNLKELYLDSSRRKRTTEVLLHLFTARLFALIQESCVNGLERDYVDYVKKNKTEVERTLQEFVFILKLLDEIKKLKD